MGVSTQALSLRDVQGVMDKALESEHGVTVQCADRGQAYRLRHRMNAARQRDRLENRKIYSDPDHPMHGASRYDQLVIRINEKPGGNPSMIIVQKVTEDTISTSALTAEDVEKLSTPSQ